MSTISKASIWSGRIVGGLVVAFLIVDGVMKLFKPAMVVDATKQLGYPESDIVAIGATLLICTLLYVIPRTSIVGAILLTGYLGGAAASQVRIGASWFNVIFAITFGVLVWVSLWLRDARVRDIFQKT